ncbi:MAG: VOC family protein [Euryarchaeota archaeon]|nr:VOC family protein [Euryarchaeota archaeon]
MPTVDPIPNDYPRLIPYITMKGAKEAITFYEKVFGAKQRGDVMPGPNGTIGHAEIEIGSSMFMLADAGSMMPSKTAKDLGGSPVNLCVYVKDADAVFGRAIENGAQVVQALEDKFYGDRSGTFQDPWGYTWTAMTHIEDVTPEEMGRRVEKMMQSA